MGFKINGRLFDWASIDISLGNGAPKEITDYVTEIEYSGKGNLKLRYGRGSKPIGWSKGKEEFEGKLTLTNEGFDILMQWAKQQGYKQVWDLPPMDINVHYFDDQKNRVLTDTLVGVKFDEPKKSAKQGDDELTVELKLLIQDIKWAE